MREQRAVPNVGSPSTNVLSKYVYGARVDEPVCMLDVADNNAAYYYHFDGLGSVVALSNSYGNNCQSYEYSVYGQVAASDPNFLANPYMFTGQRFDIETGLYYYRARYYNPHIGRFMQTDPVGYEDGINWYLYYGNNPLSMADPSGCHEMAYHHFHFTMPSELIDTTGLSLDEIPGELSDWLLSDMAIVDQMPGWDIDSVTWVPDSDEFLDVAIFYNGCYFTDPLPVDEPDLAIENVGGTKVLTVNDVGFLDDRILKNIMNPWFAEKLAMDRWNWSIADWYDDVRNCAVTPFRGSVDEEKHLVIVKQWKYRGEIYDNTEVNYVGFGFGAAHFLCPLHLSARFRVMNRNWPQLWNLVHYQHFAGADKLWFNKGWSLYPGWKPKLIF